MSQDVALQFIERVHAEECLWNRRVSGYKSPVVQYDVWCRLGEEFNATPEQVKNKWRSLQSSFRHHYNKYQQSLVTGSGADDVDAPCWFAYEAMSFTKCTTECGPTRDTLTSTPYSSHPGTSTQQPSTSGLLRNPSSSHPGTSTQQPSTSGLLRNPSSSHPGTSTQQPPLLTISETGISPTPRMPSPVQYLHSSPPPIASVERLPTPPPPTTPPQQRRRAIRRRWDEANLSYTEDVLRILRKVGEATDRLIEAQNRTSDGAEFGKWLGAIMDGWSPQRRERAKMSIRRKVVKIDEERFRERMDMELLSSDSDNS
ncbi:hypothetical protein AND_000808 [Anopheles darlingi]|uniref:MADF domain-containing protein n=1 Tax=Anopheles darlingi TaxID=43151 RepID=W5JVJ5_ANODA|nr:hypothetical protein AND_000808 [Anopheles darlingi]